MHTGLSRGKFQDGGALFVEAVVQASPQDELEPDLMTKAGHTDIVHGAGDLRPERCRAR